MSILDTKVQKIAQEDWKQFMEIAGPDFLMIFKARIMRIEGKSWQQISVSLQITLQQARTACKNIAVKK